MVFDADPLVLAILLGLIVMSIACWAIIFQKFVRITRASWASARFLDLFWSAKRLDQVYEKSTLMRASPVAEVFRAGYQELGKVTAPGKDGKAMDAADAVENLTRTLRRATSVEATSLERWVTFLATTGSTAPFIGLLGTVYGILQAFNKLGGGGAATLDIVGPDIAQALVATAVGLGAAIPAVAAYNYFSNHIRVLSTEMDNFSSDFLNIVKRQLK
ncbi:MAG: MotA/TolQ/ExbB proton channel family protein [Deltaproteobacteria bacterium]|nr:MotA/TolQ/ExbB proton channel family protein [Deltaproteobacteria bacterium]